jgi:RimJ/RimL family protein N-acetyltransferase
MLDSSRSVFELPSGRLLDVFRPRSAGVLNEEEYRFCEAHGVRLSYDPVQIGWVPSTVVDDISGIRLGHRHASVPSAPASLTFGGRYRLRRWTEEDAGVFVALLDNPKLWDFMPEDYPAPLDAGLARSLIELSNASDHHDVFAVEADGEVVGQVRLAFDPASPDRSEGEVSYWIGEAYWGRGIGSDIVAHFSEHSFRSRPGLRSIIAKVHAANEASARILEKAGYVLEGTSGPDGLRIFRRARSGNTRH